MGDLRILFGRTRWRRRQALLRMGLGGIDAFGRPAFLYVTGTQRKREQVLREFLGRDTFAPEVRVLGELAADLWHRYGDGRAILTRRALALAARRTVDDAETAWALAEVEQALAAHGATPRDPELRRRIAELREGLPPDRVRPSDATEALIARLASPSPALLAALRRHETVVVDDLVGSTPLQARLVVALARAWSAAGAHVVLAFASGRDRGGREAGVLLGWDEASDREPRAFAATSRLRQAVMEELVATGEAKVVVATADGPREIEPWSEPGPEASRDLADAFADGEAPEPVELGPIRILRCADPTDEARAVARSLAQALADGVDPRDCLVATCDEGTAAAIGVALGDHGVPFALGAGSSLASTPVGLAVRRVAALALDGFGPELCGLAERVGWSLPEDPRTVRRWCGAAGVRTGRPREWLERLLPWAVRARIDPRRIHAAIEPLEALADRIAGLAEDRTPDSWHLALHGVLAALDVVGSCRDVPEELHAWAAIVEEIDQLALDLRAVSAEPWPAAVLREALERGLREASVDPTPRSVARVPVVGVREILGLTPAYTFVVGLSAGAFPRGRAPSFLLEPDERRAVDPDPVAEGRYLLASLLRDALGEPWMRQVVLSWPATLQGRAQAPSPILAELLEVAGDVARAPDSFGPASRSDRIRAGLELDDEVLAVRAVALARTGPLGPRDGILERPPEAPAELSVTALETFLRCPARYWYAVVLGLAPPDGWAPELEPRRKGTAIHRILERFLRDRGLAPVYGEDPAPARRRLHEVASIELDAIEAEGGFDPLYQRYARERWLAGLVDERPAGILRVWLDGELGRDGIVPEGVELPFSGLPVGPITLRGKIDRVDRGPDGTRLVTDYKTGRTPTRREVQLGLSLQPVAYAEAVGGEHVATTFLSLARADDLRRTGWVGDPRALDVLCTPSERRAALALDEGGRAEVLGRAAAAAEGLVAGRFPPTPHAPEDAGCPTCPYRRICRLDPERHGASP